MALSDLQIFNEQLYLIATEIIDQQIERFNAASGNTLILVPAANKGSFTEKALFQNMGSIVRNRNPFKDSAVESRSLAHILETTVKVGSGTPEIRLDQAQFDWIKMKPTDAAAMMSKQLSAQIMADYLNNAIGVGVAAIGQANDTTLDVTAATDESTVTLSNLVRAAGKFGDRSGAIRAWVMHSASMTALELQAIKNSERLFRFDSINVMSDGFGRMFIITDSPNLTWSKDGKTYYNTLGLTENSVVVETNGDFHSAIGQTTGYENIRNMFQAEWSANYGVKGYSWNTAEVAPTTAALMTAANWKRYVTSMKDTAGVILKSA